MGELVVVAAGGRLGGHPVIITDPGTAVEPATALSFPDTDSLGPVRRIGVLAVHSMWTPQDRLAVWAEDSSGSPLPLRRRGRAPRVREHPFAATEESLLALLGDVPATGATLVLDLPTAGGPLPSPEIILDALLPDEAEESPDEVDLPLALSPWRVPALVFEPDDVPDLAPCLHEVSGTDAALGGSTRHLLALNEFAADLVSRGRVLPTAEWTRDGAAARWLPVVTGVDAGWVRSLTLALPASVRPRR